MTTDPRIPKPRPQWLDKPSSRQMMRRMARLNTWVYRRTGGRVGGSWRVGAALRKPVPVLLLDHVGRSSGKKYTTPLLYLRDGDNLVVVASSGGMAHHPQWFRNLMAAPETTVQIRRRVVHVHARQATEAEKARLWPDLVELYADFTSYQSWTGRDIPVVICTQR